MSYQLPDSRLLMPDLLEGRKPVGEVEIDCKHPLSDGLLELYLCNTGDSRVVNLVNRKVYVGNSNILQNWKEGGGLYFGGSTSDKITVDNIQTPNGYTVIAKFKTTVTQKWRNVFTKSVGSFKAPYYCFTIGTYSTGSLRVYVSNGVAGVDIPLRSHTNEVITIAISVTAVDAIVYINGVFSANATGDFIDSISQPAVLGRLDTNTGYSHDDDIYYATRYNRALSPQEIKSLHNNPYQFLIPK